MIYNIMDFGAVGDGKTLDTKAIQATIDACFQKGGGRVLIPGGRTYRTGALELRSYVELHLEMGAVLKASDNLEDYHLFGAYKGIKRIERPTYESCDYSGAPDLYFIYAKDCDYVAITGLGKINGNQEIFYGTVSPWHIDGAFYPRAPLLFLENIRHLTLHQVTLTGSAFWTTHLIGCQDVLIDGIRILNDLRLANCDGIDPDHCKNVRIVNCHIESADDCIVFKNTADNMKYGPCENIVVTGCTLTSTSAAIKFGSESEDAFRNIVVENCNISRTNRAISIQLRDKGSIENITFSNINIDTRMFSKAHWWGSAEPIAITAVKRTKETILGKIRNIKFHNINANSENGIFLYAEENDSISNINFDGINLKLTKKTEWPKKLHDIRPTHWEGIFEDSFCGVYAYNVCKITFKDLNISKDDSVLDYFDADTIIKDCHGIVINNNEILS